MMKPLVPIEIFSFDLPSSPVLELDKLFLVELPKPSAPHETADHKTFMLISFPYYN